MWKDYSISYIKNNRVSSISIIIAAFISTLFLSFLCSLFYNAWTYEIERIILDEGDWHGRITGRLDSDDLFAINKFPNVERAVVNEKLSGEEKTVVDVYFHNKKTIYQDMPEITEKLGLNEDAATYHTTLLSSYLINDPQDKQPPLLIYFYLVVYIIVSLALILIIRTSFEVSMRARIHQFGIFSSIGATPKQIRHCLIQEAVILCVVPILTGSLLGILLCDGAMHLVNFLAKDVAGRHEATFHYHQLIFILTILSSLLTVFLSAWKPARKLSRMTPLEAIFNHEELQAKRRRKPIILSRLFGIEGELAANALKVQKKAYRTSSLSLTLSFLGFTMMLCFLSLSDISTSHTYFERYQDVWDVMVTVKDTKIEDFDLTENLRGLNGVQDLIVYQKALSSVAISEERISDELIKLGGLSKVAGSSVTKNDGSWLVKAPIIIMDDEAFKKYCVQAGIEPDLNGTIILNQIWDSINSNFRYKEYIPFIKDNIDKIELQNIENTKKAVELPVLGLTGQVPVLREEYDNFTLVQFIPLSLWEKISGQIEGAEEDTYVRILGRKGVTLSELNMMEKNVSDIIGTAYKTESENRIQEKITNGKMFLGYKLFIGSFCLLLALIGFANVFTNTLSFLYQRKREFARYMSVGLTPTGMREIFIVEALITAGRPILITLPLTVLFEIFAIKASYLNPAEVLAEAPFIPVLIFILLIYSIVGLAYFIGGKRLLKCDLTEALRNDITA